MIDRARYVEAKGYFDYEYHSYGIEGNPDNEFLLLRSDEDGAITEIRFAEKDNEIVSIEEDEMELIDEEGISFAFNLFFEPTNLETFID